MWNDAEYAEFTGHFLLELLTHCLYAPAVLHGQCLAIVGLDHVGQALPPYPKHLATDIRRFIGGQVGHQWRIALRLPDFFR